MYGVLLVWIDSGLCCAFWMDEWMVESIVCCIVETRPMYTYLPME